MREIKFRGKASKDWSNNFHQQKFIYGSLILCEDEITSTIINREFEAQVDTDTVGEFTGILDRNGNEIYEGDICQRVLPNGKLGLIIYVADIRQVWMTNNISDDEMIVIGNIYENPELLKTA